MALLGLGRAQAGRLPFHADELQRTTAGALSDADRPLGPVGHLALWANLGSGLYMIVVGAWLVPALSLGQAVVVTLIGAALGSAMVASAVGLGASENRPGVVLHRGVLGETGANMQALLAGFRHLAWGAVQLAIAAELAAAAMSRQGLAGGRPLWAAILGALVLLMVLAGPATVVRRWLVPSAAVAVLIALIFTYTAWSGFGVAAMLLREPAGGWPSMTAGVDIVAALALISLPVAIDVGRLGRPRGAVAASFGGLATMTVWFVLLGVFFVPAVDGRDVPGFLLATTPGTLVLLLVVVLELDGVFVSLYALASTARAWAPKADSALPVVVVGAGVFAFGAALLDPFNYGDALLLLGAAFAPLLGVLLGARAVRRWWLHRTEKTRLLPDGRIVSVAGSVSPPVVGGAVAWVLGFLLYNWAAPLDIPAWTAAMSAVLHDGLGLPFPADVPGLSATALGFVAAFVITVLLTIMQVHRPVPRRAA